MTAQVVTKEETNEETRSGVFMLVVIITFIMAWNAKGIVFSGMIMGSMSSVAVWFIVLKLPFVIKAWMRNHMLASDGILSGISFLFLSSMTPGPTLFMAICVQAVLFSILLRTLPKGS